MKYHGESFRMVFYAYGLLRYCHRCGTQPHWWVQRSRCRHYRQFRIRGRNFG